MYIATAGKEREEYYQSLTGSRPILHLISLIFAALCFRFSENAPTWKVILLTGRRGEDPPVTREPARVTPIF